MRDFVIASFTTSELCGRMVDPGGIWVSAQAHARPTTNGEDCEIPRPTTYGAHFGYPRLPCYVASSFQIRKPAPVLSHPDPLAGVSSSWLASRQLDVASSTLIR